MKVWLRRLGLLFLVLIWLMIMVFPTFAFVLARQGQIEMGQNPRNHVRFFLVNEETDEGIGVEWARPKLNNRSCSQTNVFYLLWEGENDGQNVSFCQCYDPDTEAPLPVELNQCSP